MDKLKWRALDHRVWQTLTDLDLHEKSEFCLAVSGGLDSMVLMHIFCKLVKPDRIRILHYHHGLSDQDDQKLFRDRAARLVQEVCLRFELIFVMQQSEITLKSENDMRQARRNFFKQELSQNSFVVMAHHQDDRLETMLLKLMRGTGSDRFNSLTVWDGSILRPLLLTPKVELLNYAQEENLVWCEDPSNSEDHYLRNWLRNSWLKELDSVYPGGRENMARSLFKLADQLADRTHFELVWSQSGESRGLSRHWFNSLTKNEQNRAIFLFLKQAGIEEMTQGQIEEIRKRLDKNQKEYIFEILGRKWVINAMQIMLE